jgi:uncharacterized protein YjiS (DUF1127 family)
MQQIAHWLEKLGMSEYAERFAENKIDVSVLRHLTDQDLKDIGVALGHRRKILAAHLTWMLGYPEKAIKINDTRDIACALTTLTRPARP